MIRIEVISIFGMIAYLGGVKKQIIQIGEGSNVMDLIDFLIEKHGDRLKSRMFCSDKTIKRGISILLNGRSILALEAFETKLIDGDKVIFFPPLAGG